MRTTSSFVLLLATSLLAGCGEDPSIASEEQHETEALGVTLQAFITGVGSASRADAETSWKERCVDWATRAAALAGATEAEEVDCGTPKNLHPGSWFLLGSEASLSVRVPVPPGGEIVVSDSGRVSGAGLDARGAAMESWRTACLAQAERLDGVYGQAFVGASCGEPKNVHPGSWFRFESDLLVGAAAPRGVEVELPGYVVGPESDDYGAAALGLRAACDAWVSETAGQTAAGVLVGHGCGEPTNLNPGTWFQLGSPATLRFRVDLGDAREASASLDPVVTGKALASRPEALASWQGRCSDEAAFLAGLYGDRFIAASCGVPENVHTGSWFQYRSSLEARVAPSAGTAMIEVPGYVLGASGPDAVTAEEEWRSACHDWLTTTAALAGDDRLDGHSCGAPENLHRGSWFHFGSATVLRLRVDAASGAEPRATVAGPAQGQAFSDANAAVASWKSACAAAIDAQREAVGDALVAASCSEPKNVHTGSWFQYASDVMVWTGG